VSWDEQFASRYDEWSAGMAEDVPFYVGLAAEIDGPLVELAIGNGRVAIPLALATGRTVIGIDSSPAMIAQAHTAAAGLCARQPSAGTRGASWGPSEPPQCDPGQWAAPAGYSPRAPANGGCAKLTDRPSPSGCGPDRKGEQRPCARCWTGNPRVVSLDLYGDSVG
jgi:hypothetical protein